MWNKIGIKSFEMKLKLYENKTFVFILLLLIIILLLLIGEEKLDDEREKNILIFKTPRKSYFLIRLLFLLL